MLILARRAGDQIQIGKDIIVTLLSIRGGFASIGVTAPREVIINRMELHLKLQASQARGNHLRSDGV
jgi:carbon storage regulator